jgi:hypothetical protein
MNIPRHSLYHFCGITATALTPQHNPSQAVDDASPRAIPAERAAAASKF